MTDGMSFTVETHLLRELGDLLVGRDSTAIIELVKIVMMLMLHL